MDIQAELAGVYAARDAAVGVLRAAGEKDAAHLLDCLRSLTADHSAAEDWMVRVDAVAARLDRIGKTVEAFEVKCIRGALASALGTLLSHHMDGAGAGHFVRAAEIASGSDRPQRVEQMVANYYSPLAASEE
jgi:hypothetical protein